MTQVGWLWEIAWKGTVLLAAAFAAAAWLRRSSAAARHFLWTTALGALLLLPVARWIAPEWKVAAPGQRSVTVAAVRPVVAQPSAAEREAGPARRLGVPWLLLWGLGCGFTGAWFAAGAVRTRRIVRRAKPAEFARGAVEDLAAALRMRRRIAVVETPAVPVPLASGIVRPAIVLPYGAAEWPEGRLRTVVRHEMEHIRRYDLPAQVLGQAACCLYWFHPLAWMAARRLRLERERACDDAVLSAGMTAHDYAAELLKLARGMAARRRTWANAPAMAEACDLESRIRALFDASRRRDPLRGRTAVAIGGAVLAVVIATASLTLHGQVARGALAGVVEDPSGARVPGCRVTAKNLDGANQEATRTNAAGEYRFAAIPAGNYELEFAAPGLKLTKVRTRFTPGQAERLDVKLDVGGVSEHLTIKGQKPPTVAPSSGAPERIRVGGNVQPARLLNQTKPVYPDDLQKQGVEGTVVIRAVISMDGNVVNPVVVNTEIDPRLAQLALDAVRQWHYEPALLNGKPVETTTTMTIDFTLESGRAAAK